MTEARFDLSKTFRPVAISCSTAPKAKMSVRASASFPSSCSGAMYGTVPRTTPSSVMLPRDSVGSDVSIDEEAAGSARFARPKSRSFTPDFVSMTLAGFKSRWTIPFRWATSSADAISMATFKRCASGSGPFCSRCASVSPSISSMTRRCRPGAPEEPGISSNE